MTYPLMKYPNISIWRQWLLQQGWAYSPLWWPLWNSGPVWDAGLWCGDILISSHFYACQWIGWYRAKFYQGGAPSLPPTIYIWLICSGQKLRGYLPWCQRRRKVPQWVLCSRWCAIKLQSWFQIRVWRVGLFWIKYNTPKRVCDRWCKNAHDQRGY